MSEIRELWRRLIATEGRIARISERLQIARALSALAEAIEHARDLSSRWLLVKTWRVLSQHDGAPWVCEMEAKP